MRSYAAEYATRKLCQLDTHILPYGFYSPDHQNISSSSIQPGATQKSSELEGATVAEYLKWMDSFSSMLSKKYQIADNLAIEFLDEHIKVEICDPKCGCQNHTSNGKYSDNTVTLIDDGKIEPSVSIHELAHWIMHKTGRNTEVHHSEPFFDLLHELYQLAYPADVVRRYSSMREYVSNYLSTANEKWDNRTADLC